MAGLAAQLADRGVKVVYVSEQHMSPERAQQGWQPPDLGRADLQLIPSQSAVHHVVNAAPPESVHIGQGLRSNGLVGVAQRALAKRGLRQWVVMETVDDAGWRGSIKRLEYRRLFTRWRSRLQGVLAIGWRTPAWVTACGMPADQVFPFAYFLPPLSAHQSISPQNDQPFQFLFVGQLIELKRVDLLIQALIGLRGECFELRIIGDGPCKQPLRNLADTIIPGQVHWMGQQPMNAARRLMAQADCLVLPSRHDGWGAVVSEALMVGTPVICSDACGSAGVVTASGTGGVFSNRDRDALEQCLRQALTAGRVSHQVRTKLALWAQALGTEQGADYMLNLLQSVERGSPRPLPPWQVDSAW